MLLVCPSLVRLIIIHQLHHPHLLLILLLHHPLRALDLGSLMQKSQVLSGRRRDKYMEENRNNDEYTSNYKGNAWINIKQREKMRRSKRLMVCCVEYLAIRFDYFMYSYIRVVW